MNIINYSILRRNKGEMNNDMTIMGYYMSFESNNNPLTPTSKKKSL
jgi:hypothetical protein